MPIRIEKDDPQQGNNNQPNRGGGNNMLLRILPIILLFLFKRPKLLIPVLLIGAVWYFFLGGSQYFSSMTNVANDDFSDVSFSLGASLDQERFDQAKVFEPLSYGFGNSARLPAKVTLERFAPTALNQGNQGSCVGWASAYAAKTILYSKATGQSPNSVRFSPSYLYNQIKLQGCQGAYMLDAMKAMSQNGSLPFNEFRYDERTCENYPSRNQIAKGQQNRIRGYNRLTLGANNYKSDITGIKQNLAQGAPVVIGMMVGGTFMSRMVGQKVWYPSQNDYNMRGFGGHAMCVIGYDDNLAGGSFQIMNSWGDRWGDRGIGWVRYKDFQHFNREAYGLHPMGSAEETAKNANKLAVEFGLVDVNSRNTIALKKTSDIMFETVNPIRKGDKFKVLFANSVECYVYIFGQETDGSSYTLFPYTSKHSPYCGITGTRVFPREESLVADNLGNKDYIAMVVSKEEIDFAAFNRKLNNSRQSTFAGKLREALGAEAVSNINYKAGNTISFDATTNPTKNKVGMVIAFDKR
ncbi:MAG: C1 family peptidase [Bacteroidota bacterium]